MIEPHGSAARQPTEPPPRTPPTVLRVLRKLLTLLLLTILGFLVVLYFLQERMIFPGAATQGTPQATVRDRPGSELVKLSTPGGETITALFGPALSPEGRPLPDPSSRPALLYFYGNAMCLAHAESEFERFRRLGLNVMIPDYLGYGMSGGKPSEIGCRETAETCLEWLRSRGFEPSRVIAGGWSLGSAVAIDLASRHQLAGLMAFSTFTSTQEMGTTIVPVALPTWFYAHKFDNLGKIPTITCPIFLGHGRRDPLVPFRMFERMAAAAKGPLTRHVIDQAEHNDFFDVGGPRIDEAIGRFVEKCERVEKPHRGLPGEDHGGR
jgi:pimeloyl-ACP methyl ester carboxylesterase